MKLEVYFDGSVQGNPGPGLENKPWGPDSGPLGDMSGECWCMEEGMLCGCSRCGGGP